MGNGGLGIAGGSPQFKGVPQFGGRGNGSGGVVPIPPGSALLVWQSSASTVLPSDNLDAASGVVIGALVGGSLFGNGSKVNLAFTVEGGRPTVGQTVWLASSQDDSNTARGKGTATEPTTVMPVYPLFTQNIVPVGRCTNNDNYTIDGTCVVELALPTSPVGPTPIDLTLDLHRVTNPNGQLGNGFTTTNAQANWAVGQSWVISFTCDTTALGTANYVIGLFDGANYWAIYGDNAIVVTTDSNVSGANLGQPKPGLNVVAMTLTGGNIRCSMNGGTVQVHAGTTAGIGPGTFYWGFQNGWTRGGITAGIKLNRVLSDLELTSFSTPTYAFNSNYFAPKPSSIADSACEWYVDFTSYTGGPINAIAGPAGTGFAFTVVGTPTVTPFTLVTNNNPKGLFLDGPVPTYDSKHLCSDRQLQRVAFSTSDLFELSLFIGSYSLDDTDNGDEGFSCIFINGQPLANFGAPIDGVATIQPLIPALDGDPLDNFRLMTPPYVVEAISGDKITRIDTFDSGGRFATFQYGSTVTFLTPATSKRLIAVSDGATLGGHESDLVGSAPSSGAVISRTRYAPYPGRISAFGCQASQSITLIKSWGNGSMVPYAKYVALHAQEGNPTTRIYLTLLGLGDWSLSTAVPPTAAAFGIDYGLFLDALHAADPTASIVAAPPVNVPLYTSTNVNGETLQLFVNAVNALTTGRPWLTVVDLTGPNTITFTGGFFPTTTPVTGGQVALTANWKAAAVIGY